MLDTRVGVCRCVQMRTHLPQVQIRSRYVTRYAGSQNVTDRVWCVALPIGYVADADGCSAYPFQTRFWSVGLTLFNFVRRQGTHRQAGGRRDLVFRCKHKSDRNPDGQAVLLLMA